VDATGTVDKAISILFHLHATGTPLGVTAIGRALDLPKSSAHRLLAALGRRGLVEQDASGRYRPGLALLALGLGVQEREPIVAAARPILEVEAEASGETPFLVVARAGGLVVLDKVEGTGFLRAAPRVGERVPAHATAVGKLYRSFAPELIAWSSAGLETFTGRTADTLAALDAAAQGVRDAGYATNRDEWIDGLSVIAAPIFGGAGGLAGTLAIAAPSVRFDEPRLADRIVAAARSIERRLGEPGAAALASFPARTG